MADVVVALDAGGTKLLGGLVTVEDEIVARHQRPTPRSPEGCDPGLAELAELAGSLVATARDGGHVVHGCGVGIAEYVKSNLLTSAEVFAWDRQPVDLLSDLVGPVSVDSDVRCAALADVRGRPDLGHGCVVYISWGTGLSSTVVVDGACLEGRRGEALALGEWPVHPAVDATWTGNVEQYASGRGIGERFRSAIGRPASGADTAAAAEAGDERAVAIVTSAARALAGAIAAVVQLVDPDLVVLGGGVGAGPGRLPDLVAEAVPTFLHRPGPPAVVRSVAGADAGLVGAGCVGWRGVQAV